MAIEAPVDVCRKCCLPGRSEQVSCQKINSDGKVAREITVTAYGAKMTSLSLTPIEKCFLRKTSVLSAV